MRVLITGSRDWRDYKTIRNAMLNFPKGTVIVHGAATGADHMAHSVAEALGYKPEPHFPDYETYSPNEAPRKRNAEMVALGAGFCLAFPTANSRGTWHCVNLAQDAGIRVEIIEPGEFSA